MALRFRPQLRKIPLFSNTVIVLIVPQPLRLLAKGMSGSDKMSTYTRIFVTEAHEKSKSRLQLWNCNAESLRHFT